MAKLQPIDLPLCEGDFHAWTQHRAWKLRARAHNFIDWDNAAEELGSLGTRNAARSKAVGLDDILDPDVYRDGA